MENPKTDERGAMARVPPPPTGSPVECDTCHHWEWDHGKHGFMSGYCPIFQKVTHKEDGTKCTAWEQIHLENNKVRDGETGPRTTKETDE